ncbi:response regulator receiver domain-containing protein [Anseongella ginsenosidimutans]|uniref:histidine kinase n=1 Tax=Anseongella ginsenosidimutans TaxID=496056 RepID=A0A4R3KP31_9SPHI|nr:hybrid sensor histidine kinase/response regulator [Anseongella ginsenosidimutans]QEC53960.1 hybrid sensor histidine kinase/response regulator [Anseongella ginsenosidimutans]TCS86346.1 response regulator receiver domain-containing protein [Anseongella ginsenosidimutans]
MVNPTSDIRILFIDDEPNNLISFKASFRYNYTIYLAGNTEEAAKLLDEDPSINIIFSDQRMAGQTGVEFFEEIREKHPDPIRILITGYTDVESVIDAINKGHIFRYIKKPWVDSDIHQAIDEAHKFYLTVSLLKKKNQALEKAYNELDRFAYSATHDMRGPILSVLGIIDLMKNSTIPPEASEMIGMIENAMLKLDGYIKSLHEHYSIRRGELHFTRIAVEELICDMSALYDPVASLRKTRFLKTQAGLPAFRSDLTSLKIILTNLLSNAFKYQRKTETEKMVILDINVSIQEVIIKVSDNGIGIAEESQDDIFNIFFRATHEEFGSGFGLYNVRDILNKLNGDIRVESKENEGSTFTVTIPC